MPYIQGGERLSGRTKSTEMRVFRSLDPKHTALAGGRTSRWLFLEGGEAVVQSTFPFMTRILSSQQELVQLLSAAA